MVLVLLAAGWLADATGRLTPRVTVVSSSSRRHPPTTQLVPQCGQPVRRAIIVFFTVPSIPDIETIFFCRYTRPRTLRFGAPRKSTIFIRERAHAHTHVSKISNFPPLPSGAVQSRTGRQTAFVSKQRPTAARNSDKQYNEHKDAISINTNTFVQNDYFLFFSALFDENRVFDK